MLEEVEEVPNSIDGVAGAGQNRQNGILVAAGSLTQVFETDMGFPSTVKPKRAVLSSVVTHCYNNLKCQVSLRLDGFRSLM